MNVINRRKKSNIFWQERNEPLLRHLGHQHHTTGLFCFHNISSFDLTGHQFVRFWIKSSINQNAGDLQLLLDNTAG